MYSGTGFDSKLKLVFKSFPITMWIIQKLYENDNGNQCTLGNININACMTDKEKKRKKMWGRRGRNDYKFSMLRIDHGGYCFIMFDLVSSEPS